MADLVSEYTRGKDTKNTVVYEEQENDSHPKIAPTIYVRKEVLPNPPSKMTVTFTIE